MLRLQSESADVSVGNWYSVNCCLLVCEWGMLFREINIFCLLNVRILKNAFSLVNDVPGSWNTGHRPVLSMVWFFSLVGRWRLTVSVGTWRDIQCIYTLIDSDSLTFSMCLNVTTSCLCRWVALIHRLYLVSQQSMCLSINKTSQA